MDTPSFSDELRRYVVIFRHRAWLLAVVTVVFAGAALLISRSLTPIYQASTTVLINEAPANRTTDYTSIVTSERLAQTYAQIMTKQPVLEGVIHQLSLTINLDDLQKKIQVEPVRDTTLIEVRVEDPDPQRAANIANALVDEFDAQNTALQASRYAASKQSLETQLAQLDRQIEANAAALADLGPGVGNQAERDRLEETQSQYRQTYAFLLQSYEEVRLTEAQSTSNLVAVERAKAPEKPIRPRIWVNTILAAVVGLVLAGASIFVIESLDDTIKGPDEVTRELGLPVLGLIARHEQEDGQPVTLAEPRSPVVEAFRSLRTNIQFASVDAPLHTILVTSPSPAEGKSTVAANLAAVLSQSGRRVILLDADLRRPRLHNVLGLHNRTGVSALFVQDQVHLNGALQTTTTEGLAVVTSGEVPPNPAELLGSEKMAEILRQLKSQADLVIIDSPPVLAVTDSVVLAPRVDGVLLVFKPDTTQLAAARQTVEQLQRLGANLLGVVLNDVDLQHSRYSYYKGYYYASQHYYDRDKRNGHPWSRRRFQLRKPR